MSSKVCGWKKTVLFVCLAAWLCGTAVFADELSGDDSLSTLGILTEGVSVSPEFVYNTIEYNVTVPAGTQELLLDPVTSNPSAEIISVTGQQLTNGEGTVVITVLAENGSQCSYYLYVTPEAAPEPVAQPVTEKETQPPTEKETEPETEDPRYVRVARNSLEEAENTIETLKNETASYRDRVRLLMKILYGLIAFCVVLLFVVINLILKRRELKAELQAYAEYGYFPGNEGGQPFPSGDDGAFSGEAPYGYENGGFEAGDYAPPGSQEENYGQAGGGYDPNGPVMQEEPVQPEEAAAQQPENQRQDDPASVPRPSGAERRAKKMPEYRDPQPAPEYQPPGRRTEKDDVEVTMIDL